MSTVAVAKLGLQLDPLLPAVLDKRTIGTQSDRPNVEQIGPGLLRYETSGADSTWPKRVFCDETLRWVDLGTEVRTGGGPGAVTGLAQPVIACSASLATSYVGLGGLYFLGSSGRSS